MIEIENQLLKEIKEKQKVFKEKIDLDPWRLKYHQMAETGWLNDPNGVVQFNGVYHLYHQYSPLHPDRGPMHWGHKTSTDMVNFQEEEIFLSPNQPYNKDGVYSGSAFVRDDELHFFYTGNVKLEGDHDYTYSGREQNTIHVVTRDGFTIDSHKVILTPEDYPESFSNHVRDPKVFEKDGIYYMILGGRKKDNLGAVLLYSSKDLYDWKYEGNLLESKSVDTGYMWECPDYFELEDQSVMILSPQGLLKTEKYKYQNIHQSGYLIGNFNTENKTFEAESEFEELDYGFDFYAPQTFEDESGRRILWAWMGLGDIEPEYLNPTVSRGWQHAMTLPRELTIENNQLKQRPLVEYEDLRQNKKHTVIDLKNDSKNSIKQLDSFEMKIGNIHSKDFSISFKEDSELSYDGKVLKLTHGESGYGRTVRGIEIKKLQTLQIFGDTSSLEIFINDGSYVMTSRVYPKENKKNILFTGTGSFEVTQWELIK